ncbi:MAG: hypothetical protein ACO1NV_16290 [Leptospira bouyouniensis]
MGGMLATRFALLFPQKTEKRVAAYKDTNCVLVNFLYKNFPSGKIGIVGFF